MEVYMFQMRAGNKETVLSPVKKDEASDYKQERKQDVANKDPEQERTQKQAKLINKMEKARDKLNDSERKFARANVLLKVATLFLADGQDVEIPDDAAVAGSHETIAELRSMTRSELKLQRLKYVEQKAKYEGDRAKFRAKRYAASLQLAQRY
jgi:hypothetical protein